MSSNARKAKGTVRPAPCCRPRPGGCSAHQPNVCLEVRQHGKWVHMGVLTPEHEWAAPPPSKRTLRKLSMLIATPPEEATP